MSFYSRVLMAFALASVVCLVSTNLHNRREHRSESVSIELALLHRQPLVYDGEKSDLPAFRNRILVPLLMEASNKMIPGSSQEHFLAWRLVSAWVMFLVLFFALKESSWEKMMLGGTLLSLVCILSFGHPWEHASDFPDVAFQIGFALVTVRYRFSLLVLLACLAVFNRESAVFAGLIWVFVHGWDHGPKYREVLRGVLLSIGVYALVYLVRSWFAFTTGPQLQVLGFLYMGKVIRVFLADPHPYSWAHQLVAAIIFVAGVVSHYSRSLDKVSRRLIYAACTLFFISLVFGMLDEIRVFLPVFAIAIYAGLRMPTADYES